VQLKTHERDLLPFVLIIGAAFVFGLSLMWLVSR
jgi:hypothetical protein